MLGDSASAAVAFGVFQCESPFVLDLEANLDNDNADSNQHVLRRLDHDPFLPTDFVSQLSFSIVVQTSIRVFASRERFSTPLGPQCPLALFKRRVKLGGGRVFHEW